MSLETSMQSWCNYFTSSCTARADNIRILKNYSQEVVKKHKDYRKEIITARFLENKKMVLGLVDRYLKDRRKASEILASMRKIV